MKRQVLAEINALATAMIDNAMPVFERVESPERGGMSTPEDTREVTARALDVLRQAVPAEFFGLFEAMAQAMAPMIDDMERRKGLLMTDGGAPTTTPDAPPARGAPDNRK